MGGRDALQAAVAEQVDHAPVGELRHGEPGDAAQRLLEVERSGQHAAGVGQQPLRLLGLLEVGDVLDHVDRQQAALGRPHGPGLDPRPADLAALVRSIAHGQRLRLEPLQREPPGEALERERAPVVAEQLEALHQLGRGRAQQRLPGLEAEQPDRRLVDVDQAAVGPLHGDGVGDAGEDRLELVAGEPEVAVEPGVLEVQAAGDGQLLGRGEVGLTEAALRRRADEREVADDATARPQRHGHRRAEAQRAQELQLLLVLRDRLQHRVRDLGLQVGDAGADHLGGADRGRRIERAAAVVLARAGQQVGVGGLDRGAGDAPVRLQQLDEAPVGEPRDGEPRDHPQRLVVVERAGQQRGDLGDRAGRPVSLLYV